MGVPGPVMSARKVTGTSPKSSVALARRFLKPIWVVALCSQVPVTLASLRMMKP
jgi:hypothetical protein